MAPITKTQDELAADARAANAKWRAGRKGGVWKMLPLSGLTVRIKHLSLLDMAKAKMIPAPLQPKATQVWEKGQLTFAEMQDYLDLIEHQLRAAIVWPVLVDSADEETEDGEKVALSSMSFDEKLGLFNWLNGTPQRLVDFLGASEDR
jgi:hypothetical protein